MHHKTTPGMPTILISIEKLLQNLGHPSNQQSGNANMKVTISAWLTTLVLVSLACPAQAGPLEEACDLAYRQMNSIPHHSLNKSTGRFTDDGDSYSGCVVRLNANRAKIKDAQYPGPLFYPSEGSALYQQGWRADREADGPDGTAFRISRQKVFCLVEGHWDGGDDSDPKYVPSARYEVMVSCGYQKH
jgi:hypothetical protein